MKAILADSEEIALNIRSFWFAPEKPIDYVAGQYIEMSLPHDNPDERGQKHWFTLSSSPTDDLISITTRYAPERSSTFKQVLFGLRTGAEITISEAMGDFVLPKDSTLPLLFVVGGIGVTPIHSIVKWLADKNEHRNVHIIFAAKQLSDVVFRDLFEAYGAKLDIILSEQTKEWSGRTGQLTGELILEMAGKDPDQLIYVSGPERMTEALEAQLLNLGVTKDKLVLDFFPGYPII